MAKIQPCRNGCGQLITVAEDQGRWKPFNVSESGAMQGLHECPNSEYNKKQQQQTGFMGTTKAGQFVEAKVSQEANRAQMEINNIILKMLTDVSKLLEQRFEELNERTKSIEEMLQVIYVAGKYDEPKTAAQEMAEQQKQHDSTSDEESDYVL